jgi:hypothetical protein
MASIVESIRALEMMKLILGGRAWLGRLLVIQPDVYMQPALLANDSKFVV